MSDKKLLIWGALGSAAFFLLYFFAVKKRAIPEISPNSVAWEGR